MIQTLKALTYQNAVAKQVSYTLWITNLFPRGKKKIYIYMKTHTKTTKHKNITSFFFFFPKQSFYSYAYRCGIAKLTNLLSHYSYYPCKIWIRRTVVSPQTCNRYGIMYLCCLEAATVACSATRAPQVQPPHSKYFSCALKINLKQHTGNLRATEEPLGKFPLVFLAWQYTSYCWWITLDCFVFVLRRLTTQYCTLWAQGESNVPAKTELGNPDHVIQLKSEQ